MISNCFPRSSRLCNGDDSVRSIEKDKGLFCHLLHYQNPYLRLSPFKYEPLNMDPHVGLVRDFFSDIELDSIVQDSQDKLHSTVFYVRILKYILQYCISI